MLLLLIIAVMSRSNGHGGGRGTRRHADGDSTAEYASYFEAEYKKRWNRLVTALAQPVAHVALLNPFAGDGAALEDAVLEPFFKAPQCCCYRYVLFNWNQLPQQCAYAGSACSGMHGQLNCITGMPHFTLPSIIVQSMLHTVQFSHVMA